MEKFKNVEGMDISNKATDAQESVSNDFSYYELDGTPVIFNKKNFNSYKFINGKFIVGPSVSIIYDEYNEITKEDFNKKFPGLEERFFEEEKNEEKVRKNIEQTINIKQIESKFNSLLKKLHQEDQVKINKALDLAKKVHDGQYRDEGTPYYTHCLTTAIIAMEDGATKDEVIVSLLHDTIEDGDNYKGISEEIVNLFGEKIFQSILLLSKEVNGEKKSIEDYWKDLENAKELKIKSYDRLSNIRSLCFCPKKEKITDYIYKTKKNVIPIIEDKYPEISEEINTIINYIYKNERLSENELILIDDLKKLKKAKDSLKTKKEEIEGDFGDKKIKIEYFPVENNNKVLINIHGTYGSMYSGSGKYLELAQNVQSKKLANVVLFESSRKNVKAKEDLGYYENKQRNFMGKTFEQELNDARRVISHVLKTVPNPEDIEITINGNSLGGILGLILSKEFPQIKNISTVGTGLRLKKTETPILNGFPSEEELTPYLESFGGKFLMQYGTNDQIFDKDSFEQLFVKLKNSEKSFVKMVGVDHTFRKLNGEESKMPYKQVYLNIKNLLNGDLLGGEVYLETEEKSKRTTDKIEDGEDLDLF